MIDALEQELARHAQLCEQLLAIATKENQALRSCDFQIGCYDEQKRDVSVALEVSVSCLRRLRVKWQELPAENRAQHPHIPRMVRANQELAMKLIMLDRENEQALLRRGLVSPRHLPSPVRQQPHFVSNLYRRSAAGGTVNPQPQLP